MSKPRIMRYDEAWERGGLNPETLEVPDNVRREIERLQRQVEWAKATSPEPIAKMRREAERLVKDAEQRAERAEAERDNLIADMRVLGEQEEAADRACERAEAALREIDAQPIDDPATPRVVKQIVRRAILEGKD